MKVFNLNRLNFDLKRSQDTDGDIMTISRPCHNHTQNDLLSISSFKKKNNYTIRDPINYCGNKDRIINSLFGTFK